MGSSSDRYHGSTHRIFYTLLHKLEDAQTDPDHIKLIAGDILEMLGDKQSQHFYHLVARKIPEGKIRAMLSELKQSTVRSKARVFTSMVLDFTDYAINWQLEQEMEAMKAKLADEKKLSQER